MHDIYRDADRISNLLLLAGHNDFAQQINDAVESASIGTEALMALRHALREISRDTVNLSPETRLDITRLVANIATVLRD